MYIEVLGQPYFLTVVLTEELPKPVILGQDLLVLVELLKDSKPCCVVETQCQSQRQAQKPDLWEDLPFLREDRGAKEKGEISEFCGVRTECGHGATRTIAHRMVSS